MPSESLANYFNKRPNPEPKRPVDRLMELLDKVPSSLRHKTPDPTNTTHPDGDKPGVKSKRKRYPSPSV